MPTNPTQPVAMHQPSAGTIIEGLTLKYVPGGPNDGIAVNGSSQLTIRNCVIDGFMNGINLSGGNPGFQIYGNRITNCTTQPGHDSHAIYTEGACAGAAIHDNVLLNNGWWDGFDPNDAVQKNVAGRRHGWYDNENYGTDDAVAFYDNVVLDTVGSNCLMRHGGLCYGNVFRGGFDFDVLAATLGGTGFVIGNAHFGPRKDAAPYYGGGIRRFGNMLCRDNLFAGSAAITNNPTCYDNASNGVIAQLGWWPKPGAGKLVTPGTVVPTLEDWCKLTYGVADVTKVQPGDAPKIISWLRSLILTPPVTATPAVQPAPFDISLVLTVDPKTGKYVVKPN